VPERLGTSGTPVNVAGATSPGDLGVRVLRMTTLGG
jgi:hypothetical protein